jgi:hypothetical protein
MKDHDTSDERSLEAANALLRRKLQADHGMKESYTMEGISPQLENIWLNSVFNFEENLKTSKMITLFKHLGRPKFAKFDKLSPREISRELNRVREMMRAKHVELDCINQYDDLTIYRFITEELFNAEMFFVPNSNMTFHFIYEEFRPEGKDF